ncbi:hypothetical protein BOW53_15650 [Solemya pervernicosa gill symbiont]|uniref:PPM-type phosphatase domain-containing protein n=3 Tax=Gammaproteobacteria incertae sedis TaxID=118884 RepID=A0A1T2KZY8_9GAMM|nr:hypothetical protein [Solemya pervernicosa gill symbiont]OOZ38415.1 hypothetical protein BOW53_15650 [Solemya pervernicosa gill symbiont]QKQ28296.1 hypothetical protein HUE57_14665 [Candidatus Reidiella endopervernicosa]
MAEQERMPARLLLDLPVADDSSQVLLRSKLRAVSRRMGFGDTVRERMELVCNEMATNQLKYANGGQIQLWEMSNGHPSLDLFALDYGEGIADLDVAHEDGYTTSGTMGKGLGAIARLSHESGIYSVRRGEVHDAPWHGTASWARFYDNKEFAPHSTEVGVHLRAYHDDIHNGDAITYRSESGRLRWIHLDGLGHGVEAASVVEGVGALIDEIDEMDELLETIGRRLQGTRGAVAILGEVDEHGMAMLSGVGDMAASVISDAERRSATFAPGVLGHAYRKSELWQHQLADGACVVTASDGLRRSWSEKSFPGLWSLHPQLIALLLGNVVSRTSDDKSVFVARMAKRMS